MNKNNIQLGEHVIVTYNRGVFKGEYDAFVWKKNNKGCTVLWANDDDKGTTTFIAYKYMRSGKLKRKTNAEMMHLAAFDTDDMTDDMTDDNNNSLLKILNDKLISQADSIAEMQGDISHLKDFAKEINKQIKCLFMEIGKQNDTNRQTGDEKISCQSSATTNINNSVLHKKRKVVDLYL